MSEVMTFGEGQNVTDPLEDAIDQALRDTVFRMTPALLQSWIHDVARKLVDPQTIAERYGFADGWVMIEVLRRNETLRQRLKEERAVWFSEENLERRVRHQHQLVLYETAHENARPLFDPSTPVPQRVDLMKAFATVGGVNGMPGGGGRGMEGAEAGPRWSIQMVFPNAGKVETITVTEAPQAPVIDGETG